MDARTLKIYMKLLWTIWEDYSLLSLSFTHLLAGINFSKYN